METVFSDLHKVEQFDAFTVCLSDKKAVKQVEFILPPGWLTEAVEGVEAGEGIEIDIFPVKGLRPSLKDIDTLYKALESLDKTIYVEAAIEEEHPDFIDDESEELEQENYQWSLEMVRADKAWEIEPRNKQYGEGIRIGHPDSGYRNHPELNPENDNRLLINEDFDFVGKDEITLINNKNGGHGLGTASVIISGKNTNVGNKPFVTGIAPKAELMPLRVAKWKLIGAPILFHGGLRRLRKAINYAVDHDCHVISISLGSANLSRSLHRAIRRAVREGVIVLAAAGNRVKIVTIPARYNEVIAVAGCDSEMKPWRGSSRGHDVDVTAPSKGVWKAAYKKGKATVVPGNGTSFAVAITAGVAALWLAHWGRDALIAHYGSPENMVVEFKKLLQSTCQRSDDWPDKNWGAGIVDAEKLLSVKLF